MVCRGCWACWALFHTSPAGLIGQPLGTAPRLHLNLGANCLASQPSAAHAAHLYTSASPRSPSPTLYPSRAASSATSAAFLPISRLKEWKQSADSTCTSGGGGGTADGPSDWLEGWPQL